MSRSRTLFERLTGSIRMDDNAFDDQYDNEETFEHEHPHVAQQGEHAPHESLDAVYEEEGELAVDVFQDGNAIVVQAMTAGVKKNDLDIVISREQVTIRGQRKADIHVHDDDFFHQELYWGSFSRTIHLPDEVDVEAAEAKEEHGLLTITLPLIDKEREARLKVK